MTLSQYGFEVYALSRSNTVLSSAVEYAVSVAENKCYNLKSPSGSAGETHFLRGEFGNSEWQESLPDPEDKFDLIYSSTVRYQARTRDEKILPTNFLADSLDVFPSIR